MRNGGRVHYIHPLAIMAFFSAFTGTVASLSAMYFWPPKRRIEAVPVKVMFATPENELAGGGGSGGGVILLRSACSVRIE